MGIIWGGRSDILRPFEGEEGEEGRFVGERGLFLGDNSFLEEVVERDLLCLLVWLVGEEEGEGGFFFLGDKGARLDVTGLLREGEEGVVLSFFGDKGFLGAERALFLVIRLGLAGEERRGEEGEEGRGEEGGEASGGKEGEEGVMEG